MEVFKNFIIDLAENWNAEQSIEDEKNYEIIKRQKENEEKKLHFDNILKFADEVINEAEEWKNNYALNYSEHPILDVIRILGRDIQTKYFLNLLKDNERLPDIEFHTLLFDTFLQIPNNNIEFYDLKRKIETEKMVNLRKDVVLPWPWNRGRLISCLATIGESRANGCWRQDSNHRVELWLPMGISWVHGGNHSISTGIIQGEGQIKPDYIYDISDFYDYVYCDGLFFRNKEDDSIIEEVKNIDFAAIFEIGRKMKKHNISF